MIRLYKIYNFIIILYHYDPISIETILYYLKLERSLLKLLDIFETLRLCFLRCIVSVLLMNMTIIANLHSAETILCY